MKKKIFFLIPTLLGLFIASCGGTSPNNPSGGNEPGTSSASDSKPDPSKLDFTGVSFESATYAYDGNPHILAEVSGAPENTTITYPVMLF